MHTTDEVESSSFKAKLVSKSVPYARHWWSQINAYYQITEISSVVSKIQKSYNFFLKTLTPWISVMGLLLVLNSYNKVSSVFCVHSHSWIFEYHRETSSIILGVNIKGNWNSKSGVGYKARTIYMKCGYKVKFLR